MIARLKFERGGKPHEATLDDSGHWTSSDPFLTETLNLLVEGADRSPGAGRLLSAHVRSVAKALGARVEWPDAPATPGRVY